MMTIPAFQSLYSGLGKGRENDITQYNIFSIGGNKLEWVVGIENMVGKAVKSVLFEGLCPLKFIYWNPKVQCSGIGRWALWEVPKLQHWSLIDGIRVLTKTPHWSSLAPACRVRVQRERSPQSRGGLSRSHWHCNRGLYSPDCGEWISVLYRLPSLGYFDRAAQMG